MDRVALSECRNFLRLIQCEAVTDTNDQNLYDILIRSREKKTVLITWLIQNLFTPHQCTHSSLEDMLSMFMTNRELATFLDGTMNVADQFRKWILLMNAVYLKKNSENSDPQNITNHILDGKLLDVLMESWNQKIEKPTSSLFPGGHRTSDLQSELIAAEEQLKNLNLVPIPSWPITDSSSNEEKKRDDILQKFLDNDIKLNRTLNEHLQKSLDSSDCSKTSNSIQALQECSFLKHINQNLDQLRDMISAGVMKNSN